ncbi:MAG TPA: DegT/DnrJ/EryC1/StrS family aminotransferase [Bryobacteraceae bacterium]|nr:DegT/DnrJ/EryC1/StrS family aminotransferase [Bryobacteraceae bacterium]
MSQVKQKQVPLLDLRAQHTAIREEVLAEVTRVIDSQKFILGEEVQKLEREIAAYSGAKFGIGCASGSDALFLALLGLDVGPGDEVLTTPYTFFATAGAIHRAGAAPVFVDIEAATFNMDMNLAAGVLAAHPKIKAIIPIHLFGGCADLDPLCALARDRGIAVIEDAAQSIGSEYKGRRAGSVGEVGCFSFFPSKNLGGYGDGGMLTTNDAALGEKLGALRVHGSKRKYYHDWVGINSRLDALQAAVLRAKFRHLDSWTEGRQRNASVYRKLLAELRVPVTPPVPAPYQTRHIYNQFAILCQRRDQLQAYLKENGIGTEVYYPLPLHLQVCFAGLGYKLGDFPVSERLAAESLALPIYAELSSDDIEYVCRTVKDFYGQE